MNVSNEHNDFEKYMNPPVEDETAVKIRDKIDSMAKIIDRGNDVEIRKSKDGIKILEVTKKAVE